MSIIDRFAEEEEIDYQYGKYLSFVIDKHYYAYPISDVREIIEVQEITEVPEFPPYSKGVINLRGTIIPVIDVRLRFHKPEADYNDRTCIVVVSIESLLIGFIVDVVDEVVDIEDENLEPAPAITTDRRTKFIRNVGKVGSKIVMILDAKKMLDEDDMQTFVTAIGE